MTKYAIQNSYIKEEDRDFYDYAYPLALSYLVTWTSFLIIGAVFDFFWPSVIYMLSFSSLRIFAGGIHAGSYEKCYVVSLGVFVAILSVAKWLANFDTLYATVMLFIISVVAVGHLAPVEDPHKPLDAMEAKKYNRCVKVVLIVQSVVLLAMLFGKIPSIYCILLMLGPITVSILLWMAKRK